MPTKRHGVLIVETDGVELEYQEELDLDADNVFFDNTSNGFVSDNIQGAIEEAQNTGTEFFSQEVLVSATQQETTSNNWVTSTGWPQTSEPKLAGDYVVDFTAQLGQSQKQKQIGSRLQYRFNATGTWNLLADSEILDALSGVDSFQYRTSFTILVVPSEGDTIQFRWQFGQTDDGGTGRIKNTAIKLTKRS